MIEWPGELPPRGGPSLLERRLEEALQRWTDRIYVGDYRSHGRDAAGRLLSARELPAAAVEPSAAESEPSVREEPAVEVADESSTTAKALLGAESESEPGSGGVEVPGLERFRSLLESGAGHLAGARAAYREQCRQAAVQARELAAFAACRPAALLDRPEHEVGAAAAASRAARPAALTEVSEWAVDEAMAALGLSSGTAQGLLADAVTLVEALPATLAALEEGRIDWPKARMLAEVLTPLSDGQVRADVEGRLLARAQGRTLASLKASARRAVLAADATAAATRLAAAIRDRAVRAFPGDDGMGTLSAAMPIPLTRACYRTLEAYADACATPGDTRTKDQRMVDCLVELILRPGEHDLPPVQVLLTVVAGVDTLTGGDEPGEVDGQPVPAVLVRELAYTLGLLPRPDTTLATTDKPDTSETATANPGTTDGPATTEVTEVQREAELMPEPIPEALTRAGNEQAAADLAQLLTIRSTAGTALAEPATIAVIDEISGQLLALTHAGELRRTATCTRRACRNGARPCTHQPCGAGLGPPGDSSGYSPGDQLATFIQARDRRCRFPGCRAPAIRCDIDHNLPWPAGPTSETNLCCLCRHHHRLSHQAPGWRMDRLPDGGLRWTLPGGHTVITYPPRYGTDDVPPEPSEQSPEKNPQEAPPLTRKERVLGRRPPPATPDNDPPPF